MDSTAPAAAAAAAAPSAPHVAVAASRPVPDPSSPVWHALDALHFRHAKLRAQELPSRFLHVAMQQDVVDESTKPVSAQDVWRVFEGFGEVQGVRILPPPHKQQQPKAVAAPVPSASDAAPSHPRAPLRQYAYVSFRLKQHAAHALNALHQQCSPLLPGVRMQVHHALERSDDPAPPSDDANSSAAAASSAAASSSPVAPVPPQGLRFVPDFLAADACANLSAPVAHLVKSVSSKPYGAALEEEDDRFGLRKPEPMEEELWGEVLKKVQEEVETEANGSTGASTSSSGPVSSASADASTTANIPSTSAAVIPFNRATLTLLRPGQGLKRGRDAPHLFGDHVALLNLGPSHVLLELSHPLRPKDAWGVLLPAAALVLLSGPSRSEWEYGISSKTRDVLPKSVVPGEPFLLPSGGIVPPTPQNLKRNTTTLCVLRHVRPEPLPAPIVAADAEVAVADARASTKLAKREQRAKGEEEEERQGKKVHSTAMLVPGSSSTSASGSDAAPSASVAPTDPDAEQAAAQMESLHVTGVYDSIASHFSATRHSPWPRIERFVESLPAGAVVADVGCGNGKYMGLNKGIAIRGCDASAALVRICREERGFDVILGDLMQIPFESRAFDAVLCIAVLHHISTLARRQRGIRELVRLLKPGGVVLVSAWAMEQDVTSRRAFPSQDVLVPWAIPREVVAEDPRAMEVARATAEAQEKAAKAADNAASSSDSTDPAPSSSPSPSPPSTAGPRPLVHFQRYCHVYVEGELESVFSSQFSVGEEIEFVERYYDRGNWCVVVRKLKETRWDEQEAEEERAKTNTEARV